MEQKSKRILIILIIFLVTVILAGGALFGILYFPAQKTYQNALNAARDLPYNEAYNTLKDAILDLDGNPLFTDQQSELSILLGEFVYDHTYESAMDQSSELPYEEACAILRDAMATLEGKPQYADRYEALRRQLKGLTNAEITRAIDGDKTDYALDLIRQLPEAEQQPFYGMIYANADALLAAGQKLDAIALFEKLGTFSDASVRIDEIREGIRFEEAAAVFTGGNYDEGAAALRALGTARGDAAADQLEADRIERRATVQAEAQAMLSVGAWHTAWLHNGVVRFSGDARYTVPETEVDRIYSGLCSIVGLKDGKVIPFGETFGAADTIASLTDVVDMDLGLSHALFLSADGTVTGVGSLSFDRLDVSDWVNVCDVAAGAWHSVGCSRSGTVSSTGNNDFGQCNTTGWTDVVSVDAGLWHTVGLRSDGTVVACGDNTFGQCDVSEWTDVSSISCGACYTVALKTDGTVVACGDSACGQCDVFDWTEVAAIAAGAYHTAAVRVDGTMLISGLAPHEALYGERLFDSNWIIDPVGDQPSLDGCEKPAYVEGRDSEYGPWLYLDQNGAVLICLDDSEDRMPFRVDLFATANALPEGRVVNARTTNNDDDHALRDLSSAMPDEQARKAHAVVAFTGDYIGFTSNRKGVMIRGGIVYYDRDETDTLAMMPDGTLKYFDKGETSAAKLLDQGVRNSFSFWPLLVLNGKSMVENSEANAITMRVAFGYTDPYHYITVVSQRDRECQLSYKMTADILLRYGARIGYNFDGGHSTSLVFMGRELSLMTLTGVQHYNIRALSDVVVFLESDEVQPEEGDTP